MVRSTLSGGSGDGLFDAKSSYPMPPPLGANRKPVINMRKPVKTISISLDKVPVFASQVLRGTLNFALRDATNVKSITLIFEGNSKTSCGNDSTTKEQWLFRVEVPCLTYLMRASLLNNNVVDAQKFKLEPGDHVIPFAFPIPPHVPSSFGGKYGYVYYCVKAVILTSATIGSAEFRAEQPIPLIGIEDLNWHKQVTQQVAMHQSYQKRRLCLKQTDVDVVLRLPKSGYLPGETIPVNCEVMNNHRSRHVKRAGVELVQSVHYKVGAGKERVVRNVLAQILRLDIAPNSVEVIDDEPMKIPGCPPSFMRGAENITIVYNLNVTVDASTRLRVPLIIGTVPLCKDQQAPRIPITWKPANPCDPKSGVGVSSPIFARVTGPGDAATTTTANTNGTHQPLPMPPNTNGYHHHYNPYPNLGRMPRISPFVNKHAYADRNNRRRATPHEQMMFHAMPVFARPPPPESNVSDEDDKPVLKIEEITDE